MSIHRQAAKRDANERPIIDGLEGVGATVKQLSSKGVCDLLVGFRGVNYLIEVKQDKAKLTPDQVEFFEWWQGQRGIARTLEDALRIIGAID